MLLHSFKSSAPTLQTLATGFLLYNVLAFGLQPVIGSICDAKKKLPIAVIGCFVILFGFAFFSLPWIAVVLCALGNACFHIGGGRDGLLRAEGKMARSGIFVSSGALGVSLGTLSGQSAELSPLLPVLLIAVSGVLIHFFARSGEETHTDFRITAKKPDFLAVVLLCMASIVIRSFVGLALPVAWKTTAFLLLLPGIGSCIGKAAGGALADRFGARNVGVLSLLLSLPLLCLFNNNPALCTIGIVLFNMTMPIALCALASKLPDNPGLSFGLTTLCLLCGSVPTFFFALPAAVAPAILAPCIVLSAVCLFFILINQKGVPAREKMDSQPQSHAV